MFVAGEGLTGEAACCCAHNVTEDAVMVADRSEQDRRHLLNLLTFPPQKELRRQTSVIV
jgi:hypothetical protein